MITATVNMDVFNAGMRGLIRDARIAAPVVVKKEAAELIKTLVRVSPPKDPRKTKQDIESNVMRKFTNLDYSTERGRELSGTDGTIYYRADTNYLFGLSADKDFTGASVKELRTQYYAIKDIGQATRSVYPFRNRKGSQRVAILQNIATKKETKFKLARLIQNSVGRLKAGWMVAVRKGELKLSGANMPPKWVTKHLAGARGDSFDGTGSKDKPSFTIINRAKGIGQKQVNHFVGVALKIRGKAMAKNVLTFTSGKKRIADYAK